ncbi:phosphatase PAP2 family protein [Patescibacteria group bacterium]|nr:phosphatase PAP2 family protein [Patescibacteria group bacterium]
MSLDLNIFFFLNGLTDKSRVFDIIVIFFAQYIQYFLVVLFFIFLFYCLKNKQEKIRAFLTTIVSIIVSRVCITGLIRLFYHRPRPFIFNSIHQLIFSNGYSFPSGHSAFFFAMATAIYFYNKKLGITFFIAAIFMNMSRVISGVHYPSDIVGGMIIGIISALFVRFFTEKRFNKKLEIH